MANSTVAPSLQRGSRPQPPIVPWAWSVLVLLLLQNFLGIYLNLFVSLPQGPDLLGLMAIYAVLAAHVVVGISLLVGTGIVLLLAARAHRRDLWLPALVSFASTFAAFESGIEFVIGGQEDWFSFLMEAFFLAAVAFDVLVLVQAVRLGAVHGSARDAASEG